jgi:phage regulator Rha-like protein
MLQSRPTNQKIEDKIALVEKRYLEHQTTIAKLGAHMGLGNQVNAQGPCGHQILQL